MKKLFIVLMALVMAGTCAACAQNPSESAGPTKDALTPGASLEQTSDATTEPTTPSSTATPTPNEPEYLGYTANKIGRAHV